MASFGQCDCCGEMKFCTNVFYPPVGDTFACGPCQGGDEIEADEVEE